MDAESLMQKEKDGDGKAMSSGDGDGVEKDELISQVGVVCIAIISLTTELI